MGIVTRGNASIRTNGPTKAPPPEPPKKVVRWYEVLMTHAGTGGAFFKKGALRGLTSQSEAEALAKRGLIKAQHTALPEDAVSLATNPAEALVGDGKEDKVRNMLNEAARTAWKPGMKPRTSARAKQAAKAQADAAAKETEGESEAEPSEADTSAETALPRPRPRRTP